MTRRRLAWSATEIVGLGINNPRPVAKLPVPPELRDRWEEEAHEQGVTLDAYLDDLFAEAEDATKETP
jgi:hypothetical protein